MTKSAIALIVLGVVAVSLWAYYGQISNSGPTVTATTTLPVASAPKVTTTTVIKKTQTSSAVKSSGISYSEAINKYANSRIQLDADCHANPAMLHVKNGSNVMLDNRSEKATRVSVDGVSYSLSGYKFQIINLYHKTLPYTASVDCGSGKNTAQILLQ